MAFGPFFFSIQNSPGDFCIFLRCSAGELILGTADITKLLWRDLIGGKSAVTDLAHRSGCAHGDLIQLVLTIYHHAPGHTQIGHHASQRFHQTFIKHTHQLHISPRRVA